MSDDFAMKTPQQLTEEIIQADMLYWRRAAVKVLRNEALALCAMMLALLIDGSELSGQAFSWCIASAGIAQPVAFSYGRRVIRMRSATACSIAADVVPGKDCEFVSSEEPACRSGRPMDIAAANRLTRSDYEQIILQPARDIVF